MDFKPGDKVICVEPQPHNKLYKDEEYTVNYSCNGYVSLEGFSMAFYPRRFKAAPKEPYVEANGYSEEVAE